VTDVLKYVIAQTAVDIPEVASPPLHPSVQAHHLTSPRARCLSNKCYPPSTASQNPPPHNKYRYSGLRSPISIFSYSVTPKSLPALSLCRFCPVTAIAYRQHASPLKQANPIQIPYPGRNCGASLAKKAYVAIIPPILPKPICQAVPTARRWWPPRLRLNQHTVTGRAE